ncbi:AMP-binding protein [Thioclava sp. FR2]|uniref:AMP-binding protein n=1 Tax=Thioclava sp. FR2 TaxID=3445780 RepID=UPI003EBFFC4A
MLIPGASYDELYRSFAWAFPKRLNMAAQVLDDWAESEPDRLAIIDMTSGRREISYGALFFLSLRVGAALTAAGVTAGDRVGVLLSQSALTAAAHAAIWRIGAISVPLFKLFRHDALESRVRDAGLSVAVSDEEGAAMLAALSVRSILEADLPEHPVPVPPVATGPETPACLIYTSGTTGKPKGALHGHRMLTGHLPGVELSHDLLGQPGDVIWTPADWAWIGGLFDVLMPGLALGVPVVAARFPKFTAEDAQRICKEAGVRNVFFPPTALRMLKASDAAIPNLRSVASGGEPLGAEMLDWGRRAFCTTINEFYGQTECNMVASSASTLFQPRPGCIGKAAPGFRIGVIDESGNEVADGDEGDIAIHRGAGSMMLEYWQRPDATAEKFRGNWMVTGDRGRWDKGYLRFVGREDDVITSAGYRIGPGEIEDCLMTHPAVATVGVVGKPDPLRTEIVKAYVVLKTGAKASADDLKEYVKGRLSSYSYPREISFLEALPMTVTGKVIRKDLKAIASAETQAEIGEQR